MAIQNRSKADPEKKEVIQWNAGGAIATGTTRKVFVAPYPCTVEALAADAAGVSNAMQVEVQKRSFIVGAGATSQNMGISNLVLQNSGLSGVQNFSGLAAAGSTLLNLAAGDAVDIVTSVANGNSTDLALALVIKKTQEIVSYFGD